MTSSPSYDAIPDESEAADAHWLGEGERCARGRCGECRHWWPCEFVHPREAGELLGRAVVAEVEDAWGACDLDGRLAHCGTREGVEHGNDCWEAR